MARRQTVAAARTELASVIGKRIARVLAMVHYPVGEDGNYAVPEAFQLIFVEGAVLSIEATTDGETIRFNAPMPEPSEAGEWGVTRLEDVSVVEPYVTFAGSDVSEIDLVINDDDCRELLCGVVLKMANGKAVSAWNWGDELVIQPGAWIAPGRDYRLVQIT